MLKDTYIKLRDILARAGIESPGLEARLLIESATGMSRAAQIACADKELDCEQALLEFAEKRAKRYPLQYILGSWSFMGIELKVGEGVLIPRDDTEVLVDLCLGYLKDVESPKVVDLCAGSGAIGIALNRLANASVTAVELSDRAYYFLLQNIKNTDITPLKSDVTECYNSFEEEYFDLIVSNPPYIKTDELKTLQPEVGFEPETALDGGADGLDFYREITRLWTPLLKKGGAMAFELGEGQAEPVAAMLERHGYSDIKTALDLGGTKRAIIAVKPR